MSSKNHVVWRDGLFLKPHHFQQQQRYFENLIRTRSDSIDHYQSGFSRLDINGENLLHSKIALDEARGLFSDGSLFSLPTDAPSPVPLDLSDREVANKIVYLALPLKAKGVPEIQNGSAYDTTVRMASLAEEARDVSSSSTEPFHIDVAQFQFELKLEGEDLSSHALLPVTRVSEKRSDGSLVLDDHFMPPATSIQVLPRLNRVLDDFTGLMIQRAKQLAGQLGSPGQNSVSDIAEFLLLQVVNRLSPLFRHYGTIENVHPKELYELFISSAGELATFTHSDRLAENWPIYNHAELHTCFDPVIASLRRSLGTLLERNATPLSLEKHQYGITTSHLPDQELLNTCIFILAVRANTPIDQLARDFPAQTKVSSLEKIRDLVNLQLPGVKLQTLPSAPRQLPYHAGYTYFQLDANSPGWEHVKGASGFAFHISGKFPDLEMQFWAVRT